MTPDRVPQSDPWRDTEKRERPRRREKRIVGVAFAIAGLFLLILLFGTLFGGDDADARVPDGVLGAARAHQVAWSAPATARLAG
jgi:hypothetical protein